MEEVQTTRALGSRYVLERVLGTGAMGQVWVAVDQRTGEQVAAKLLRQEYTQDAEIIARFVQERSILVGLVHPNVVRVRDLVVEGEDLAIVMDLVEGSDLRGRLRDAGTLAPAEAVRVAVDVLSALAAAHAAGVLHRDVKPDNVLMGAGDPPQVLLSDFSIARLAQETTVRMTGVLGTAEYIAPEVFTSEQVSAAADVYGTGVLLYELLAGRTPFAGGGTGYAVAHRHVNAAPPPVPGLPPQLAAPLQALLAKDPTRRPTAAAAAAELRALLPGLAGAPALPPAPAPTDWAPADGPGGELGVAGARAGAAADLDPGRTSVKAAAGPVVPAPAPAAADGGWVGPQAAVDEQVLSSQTQLRSPRARTPLQAPAAPEQADATEPPTDRRWWWVGGAAALAVAAVAGVLLTGRGGDAEPAPDAAPAAPSISTVTAAAPPETTPAGLTTLREASYDPDAGTLTTTLTWSSSGPALSGPFYEAVPPAEPGEPCPDAVWDVAALRDATPGIAGRACGWEVAVAVPARGSASAAVTVPFDLAGDDDPVAALREVLRERSAATGTALDGLPASAAYPAQRLVDLDVQVGGQVRVGSALELVVLPVWRGTTSPDNVDVVFSSRSPAPNLLLQQLGGELAVATDDCTGALAFTDGVPYANTVASRCTISVRLGALDARSRSFDVQQNSTG